MSNLANIYNQLNLKSMSTYFNKPVADRDIIAAVVSRAKAFQAEKLAIPCVVDTRNIYEIPSPFINCQTYAAILDFKDNSKLVSAARKKLGAKLEPDLSAAVLLIQRAFDFDASFTNKAICLTYDETILLLEWQEIKQLSGKLSARPKMTLHALSPRGTTSGDIGKTVIPGRTKLNPTDYLNKFIPPASQGFSGGNNRLLALQNGQWGLLSYIEGQNSKLNPSPHVTGQLISVTPSKFEQSGNYEKYLTLAVDSSYLKYRIKNYIIPGLANYNELPTGIDATHMAYDLREDGGGGGGGGGAGTPPPTPSSPSSGTLFCSTEWDTRSDCKNCCLGSTAIIVGTIAGTAGSAAVSQAAALVATGPFGWIVLGLIVVAVAVVVAGTLDQCYRACDRKSDK